MKYCENCGSQLKDVETFCPNCGKRVNENESDNPKENGKRMGETLSSNNKEQLSTAKKIVLGWAFITACLFFLLGFSVEEEGLVYVIIALIAIGLIVCTYLGKINQKYTWYISLGSILFMTILYGSANPKGDVEKQSSVEQKNDTEKQKSEIVEKQKTKETKKNEQIPPKSPKDEIRELGFNNGVKWAYEDRGNALREYIQSGLSMSMAEGRIKQIGRLSYKEDYGSDISDDLLNEYGEKFCEGYKSIVIKK